VSAPGGPPARTGRILASWQTDVPRTRPPRPVRVDDELLKAWADYEAANQRANDEYELHPFAACSHHGYCRREDAS